MADRSNTEPPSTARLRRGSITDLVCSFLEPRGNGGATLKEIYLYVHSRHDNRVLNNSIQGSIFRRLPNAKSKYKPMFERVSVGDEIRYRLLRTHGDLG